MAQIKEPGELAEIFTTYKKLLVNLAQTYCPNDPELVINIVEDVIVVMLEHRPEFPDTKSCIVYMKKVVRNNAINAMRNKDKVVVLEDWKLEDLINESSEKLSPYDKFESSECLKTLIAEYEPKIIDAFVAHVLDGIPSKILAEQLGMTHEALRKQFTRMKKKLSGLSPALRKEILMILAFMSQ